MRLGFQDNIDCCAREGVGMLMKDELFEKMLDCISSRLLDETFKCDRCRNVMVAYVPRNAMGGYNTIWGEPERVIEDVDPGENLCKG